MFSLLRVQTGNDYTLSSGKIPPARSSLFHLNISHEPFRQGRAATASGLLQLQPVQTFPFPLGNVDDPLPRLATKSHLSLCQIKSLNTKVCSCLSPPRWETEHKQEDKSIRLKGKQDRIFHVPLRLLSLHEC